MGLFSGKAVTAADIKKALDAFNGETERMQRDLEAKKRALTRALARGEDSAKMERAVAGLQLALDGRPAAFAALSRELRRADRAAALAAQRAEGAVVRQWVDAQVAAGKKLAAACEAFFAAVAAFRAGGEARPAAALPDNGQATQLFAALGLEGLAPAIYFELAGVDPGGRLHVGPRPSAQQIIEGAAETIKRQATVRVDGAVRRLEAQEAGDPDAMASEPELEPVAEAVGK